jgi:DNA-binding HxlR family transcriptional regulator
VVGKLECPIMSTMAMISDKWKVLIICKLRGGTLRFNELMRALQGVTQKVLTSQLRELEDDGLVSRKI